jgi:hypothetical protein
VSSSPSMPFCLLKWHWGRSSLVAPVIPGVPIVALLRLRRTSLRLSMRLGLRLVRGLSTRPCSLRPTSELLLGLRLRLRLRLSALRTTASEALGRLRLALPARSATVALSPDIRALLRLNLMLRLDLCRLLSLQVTPALVRLAP